MGMHTGAKDMKQFPLESELLEHFGKAGKFFYQIVRGIDNREVQLSLTKPNQLALKIDISRGSILMQKI